MTLEVTRSRLRYSPVCQWESGIRWCRKVAVTVERIGSGSDPELDRWGARCADHAPPDAVRVCLTCKGENRSRDPYHCRLCSDDGEEPERWR
jgi:hypothetical protein